MGNRLLLADDSITIQKVVAIIFANEEFELTVVDNGNAALDKAREIRPDVMLVDALMPGKTGYEVCTEIRRDPNLSSVPMLLLIGAFEPLDEQKARDCGADASISKPFESQQLIDKVKELLELGKTRTAAPAAAPSVSAAQAAPAAKPLPLEAAAEELWGDLSAFDTMPPVTEPAAFAAPVPPAAPAAQPAPQPAYTAPAAPAAAPRQAAPAFAPQPAAAPPAVDEEIVEASYEDDLWGAFDLEEIPATAPGSATEAFGVLEPDAEFEAEELFSFEEDDEEIAETGPALEAAYIEEEPVVHPSAEDVFSFEDVSLVEASRPEAARATEPAYEPSAYEAFAFEPEPEPAPATAAAPVEEAWEPPVMEPQGVPAWAPAPEVVPAQPHAAPSISEADLAAAISRISREVIEKIVWEVVPDLAEVLIKEEIRKLRAGVRD